MAIDHYHEVGLGLGGITERDLVPHLTTLAQFLGLDEEDPLLFPPFFASATWLIKHGFQLGFWRPGNSCSSGSRGRPDIPRLQKFVPRVFSEIEAEQCHSFRSCDQDIAEDGPPEVEADARSARSSSNSFTSVSSDGSREDAGEQRCSGRGAVNASEEKMRAAESSVSSSFKSLASLAIDAGSHPASHAFTAAAASTGDGRTPLLSPAVPSPSRRDAPTASEERVSQIHRPDWWADARVKEVPTLEEAVPFTQLVSVRARKAALDAACPWSEGSSLELYEEMGATDPSKSYVVLWMNFGKNNFVSVSEVIDCSRLETFLTSDPLCARLKLLLQPVVVSLPFPSKRAKDCETVGRFFGKKHTSIFRSRARCGADLVVAQVDIFSKWLIKTAINQVGFRSGNVIDIILLDWLPDCPASFAGVRLSVTEELLKLLNTN